MRGRSAEVGAEALGEADAAQVEARVEGDAGGAAEDELGRAAADVDDNRSRRNIASGGTPRKVRSASSSPPRSRVLKA